MWRSTSMDSTTTGRSRVCILWRGGVSCPVYAAWHSCVTAHWSKNHCFKQAPSRYDLRCLKATLNPNKQTKDLPCSWRVVRLWGLTLFLACCEIVRTYPIPCVLWDCEDLPCFLRVARLWGLTLFLACCEIVRTYPVPCMLWDCEDLPCSWHVVRLWGLTLFLACCEIVRTYPVPCM